MTSDFDSLLSQKAHEAGEIVFSYMPKARGRQKRVYEAMEYCLAGGGKRLRPVLMLAAFGLFGGDAQDVYPFMAAIEMIHNYSLIHDDLPAMDDDELRRGRATCHVVYGEAMAVLAGDGLLNLAFETAAGALVKRGGLREGDMAGDGLMGKEPFAAGGPDAAYLYRAAAAINVLSVKAGCRGMIGGQVCDVLSEGRDHVPEDIMDEIRFIHEHKTAALLEASLMIGGIMGGASPGEISTLEHIGSVLGLAFQIRDDILDVTGDEKLLGKPVGSDEKNEKATYVSVMGIDEAKASVDRLTYAAMTALDNLPGDHEFLAGLFDWLISRNN